MEQVLLGVSGGSDQDQPKTVLRTRLRKIRVAPNQVIVQISTKYRGSFNPNSDFRNLPFGDPLTKRKIKHGKEAKSPRG